MSMSTIATTLAKSLSVIILIHGSARVVAPKTMLALHGAPQGPKNTHLHRTSGQFAVAFALAAACMLFFGGGGADESSLDLTTAVGLSQIPCWLVAVYNILAGHPHKHGYHPGNDWFPIFVSPLIMYACLVVGQTYGNTVAMYFGYFMCFNGVTASTLPVLHSSAWGTASNEYTQQLKAEPILKTSMPTVGLHLLLLGTFIVTYGELGWNATQAFGASCVWAVIMTMLPLLTNGLIDFFSLPNMAFFLSGMALIGSMIMAEE